jgi:sulfoxide reductase heme-binding subunit YedZ
MQDVKFNKFLLSLNALIPLAFLLFDWYRGELGANPIEFFLRTAGVLTLVFILLTLSVTPLRKMFGWNGLVKFPGDARPVRIFLRGHSPDHLQHLR